MNLLGGRPARLLSKREVWAGLADEPISPEVAEHNDYWLAHMNANVCDDRRAHIIFYLHSRGVTYMEPWMSDDLAERVARIQSKAAAMAAHALSGGRERFAVNEFERTELTGRFMASLGDSEMRCPGSAVAHTGVYLTGDGRYFYSTREDRVPEIPLLPPSPKRPAFLGDRDWAVIVHPFTPPLERWQCAPRVVNGVYTCDQRLPTSPGHHPRPSYHGYCWCNRYLLIAGSDQRYKSERSAEICAPAQGNLDPMIGLTFG